MISFTRYGFFYISPSFFGYGKDSTDWFGDSVFGYIVDVYTDNWIIRTDCDTDTVSMGLFGMLITVVFLDGLCEFI